LFVSFLLNKVFSLLLRLACIAALNTFSFTIFFFVFFFFCFIYISPTPALYELDAAYWPYWERAKRIYIKPRRFMVTGHFLLPGLSECSAWRKGGRGMLRDYMMKMETSCITPCLLYVGWVVTVGLGDDNILVAIVLVLSERAVMYLLRGG